MVEGRGVSGGTGIVILGAGQGGLQVATSLRDDGYRGAIRLVGEEPGLPYQRPPLSKAYLAGKVHEGGLDLRTEDFFREREIELLAPERALRIDRGTRTVGLASGAVLSYDRLVLATGSRNRLLTVPGATLDGVFYLRLRTEADLIRARLAQARRIVVVGAGFTGLEFASLAASLGIEVTVVEAASRPMARSLSVPMSDYFRQAHEAAGLRFLFETAVTGVTGEGGRASGVVTADGALLPADLVLVGIGVVPNVELAAEAGLAVENGIRVDEYLATGDEAISAIGDCASYPSAFAGGRRIRLESVQNAVDQARCLAARLAGRPAAYDAVPWFWSDQGRMKLQIAGLTAGHDEAVPRGDPGRGAFSVFCYGGGRLLGVESVNRPADHMIARRLMARGLGVTPAEAADLGLDLKARAHALLEGG